VADVEHRLRRELVDAGVEDLPDEWVEEVARRIASAEPVVVEVDEHSPPQ
jgi:hypothetical protein